MAGSLGYITIDIGVDPQDWVRQFSEQIVRVAVKGVTDGEGNVITLHDAGGIRTATVDALPQLIDELRALGYQLVTVHEFLGLPRDQVLPPVIPEERFVVATNQAGFGFLMGIGTFFSWLLW